MLAEIKVLFSSSSAVCEWPSRCQSEEGKSVLGAGKKVVQVNEKELQKLFVRFRKIVLDLLGRRIADK